MEEYFKYLDVLRETGVTNMFGAGPWLRRTFDMDERESHRILGLWMDTFDGKSSVQERVAKAEAQAAE